MVLRGAATRVESVRSTNVGWAGSKELFVEIESCEEEKA
jgi:hypothetical protein